MAGRGRHPGAARAPARGSRRPGARGPAPGAAPGRAPLAVRAGGEENVGNRASPQRDFDRHVQRRTGGRGRRQFKASDGKKHLGSSQRPVRGGRPFPGPPPDKGPPLRFLPVGGLGEIGMNCALIGHHDRYVMLDAGLLFPDAEDLGMQKILPDTSFLHQWRDKVEAVVISHAHEDHIGALPWVVPALDPACKVYACPFVMNLIERRMREYNLWGDGSRFRTFNIGETLAAGPFEIDTLRVTHSIPDCCAMLFRCADGTVFHTGDWKMDESPLDGEEFDKAAFERIGAEGATLMMSDSTNVLAEGRTNTEVSVAQNLMRVCEKHNGKGRIIVTQFASNLHRMASAKAVADATGRKLAYAGMSIPTYLEAAAKAGRAPFDPEELLELQVALDAYDPSELLIVSTGSQAEPRAALNLAANGASPLLKLEETDLVVYSANQIPGNEARVAKMFNKLTDWGVTLAQGRHEGLHASGHAKKEELREVIRMVNPQNFLPVHGEYTMLRAHAALARECGVQHTEVIRNGEMIGFGLKQQKGRQFGDTSSMTVSLEAQRLARVQKIGEVQLHSFYNDGNYGTGTAEEMALEERMKIGTDGIVIVNAAVLRPPGVKPAQRGSKRNRDAPTGGLKARYRIQTRAMWEANGKLIEFFERAADAQIDKLTPDTPLPIVELKLSEAIRNAARKFNRKNPEVVVFSHEVKLPPRGGGGRGPKGPPKGGAMVKGQGGGKPSGSKYAQKVAQQEAEAS